MNKKIIALAVSDFHLHNFSDFDIPKGNRFKQSYKVMLLIYLKAGRYNVPVLNCGDWFHNPKDVENNIVSTTLRNLDMLDKTNIHTYTIPGNHDQSEKHTLLNESPNYLQGFEHFKTFHSLNNNLLSLNESYALNLDVYGIPYYTYEKDWMIKIKEANKWAAKVSNKRKILLLHGNAPFAQTTTGQTIEDCILPKQLDKFFKHWDLVLFGHIHKPQRLSKKCIMLGSPIQQNRGDEGIEMGYWEIHEDMTAKFISLNDRFPEFITLTEKQFLNYENVSPKKFPDYIIHVDDPGQPNQGDKQTSKGFSDVSNRNALSKAYMRAKRIKSKSKKHALIKILNEV